MQVLTAGMAFLNSNLVWGILMTVGFGAGLIGVIVSFVRKVRRCSVEVDAQVVGLLHSTSTDSDGHTSDVYAPEYTYYFEGTDYRVHSSVYSNGRQYQIGSIVTLRIDPEHPEKFLDLKRDRKSLILRCVVLGVFFAIGLLLLISSLKRAAAV